MIEFGGASIITRRARVKQPSRAVPAGVADPRSANGKARSSLLLDDAWDEIMRRLEAKPQPHQAPPSMLDQFALAAVGALRDVVAMTFIENGLTMISTEDLAAKAYEIAHAMMAERAKHK